MSLALIMQACNNKICGAHILMIVVFYLRDVYKHQLCYEPMQVICSCLCIVCVYVRVVMINGHYCAFVVCVCGYIHLYIVHLTTMDDCA